MGNVLPDDNFHYCLGEGVLSPLGAKMMGWDICTDQELHGLYAVYQEICKDPERTSDHNRELLASLENEIFQRNQKFYLSVEGSKSLH